MSGYATKNDLESIDVTGQLGDYAKTTDVDSKLTNKVDKVTGKDLSTNDYTNAEKQKLAGISAGANKYIHPSTHSASMITETSDKKFVTDAEKKKVQNIPANPKYTDTVTTINGKTGAISKSDITALGIPGSDTTYTTATQSTNGLMSTSDKRKLDGLKQVTKQDIKNLGFPEHVVLTETAYNALSSTQKNASDIFYYIKA